MQFALKFAQQLFEMLKLLNGILFAILFQKLNSNFFFLESTKQSIRLSCEAGIFDKNKLPELNVLSFTHTHTQISRKIAAKKLFLFETNFYFLCYDLKSFLKLFDVRFN